MPRCPSCPVAAGLACVSELRPDVALCHVAGTAPHWDRHITGRSAIERDSPAPPPEPALPPLATQAANLAGAALRHVAGGLKKADAATLATRLATCQSCEHLRPSDNRCGLCGCGVAIKAAWLSERCPDGRW